MNEDYYFNEIVGYQLTSLGHAADMIWVTIGNISVHLQADTVVYLDGEVLTQTSDIYKNNCKVTADRKQHTIFDVKVATLFQGERRFIASSIFVDADLNLHIAFSDGLFIKTIPDSFLEADDEKWRILIKGSNLPHMVAEGKSINWV